MLTLIPILYHLMKADLTNGEIMDELTEIVDNGRSEYFDLTDRQIESITKIFYNDQLFESALVTARNYTKCI